VRNDRLYEARRAGVRNRLSSAERLPDNRVDALLAGWEAEARTRGLDRDNPDFWREGTGWIYAQLGKPEP